MLIRRIATATLGLAMMATAAPAAVVNIDVTSLFNVDDICNYYNTVEDLGNGARSSYMVTNAFALNRSPTTGNGLPDDGFFPAAGNGVGFDVQLAYRNSDNGNNSIELTTSNQSVTVNLATSERAQYSSLYLFTWAKEGTVPLNYVITYTDNTTSIGSLTIQDWFNDNASWTYLIDGMDRYYSGSFENKNDPAIFALSLSPLSGKTIKQIDLTTGTVSTNRSVVIMGMSGQATFVPEPASLALLSASALCIGIRPRRRKSK